MNLAAKRYAEAYFSLALQLDKVEAFKRDCKLIEESLTMTKGVDGFLSSAEISKEDKKKVIGSSFENQIDKMSMNFLYVLIDKNRLSMYKAIFKEFYSMANLELGLREGYVESPRPLDEIRIKALEDALSDDKFKVILENRINEDLISGFKVVLDGQIIDGSMKEKIRRMNEMLLRKDGSLWN